MSVGSPVLNIIHLRRVAPEHCLIGRQLCVCCIRRWADPIFDIIYLENIEKVSCYIMDFPDRAYGESCYKRDRTGGMEHANTARINMTYSAKSPRIVLFIRRPRCYLTAAKFMGGNFVRNVVA